MVVIIVDSFVGNSNSKLLVFQEAQSEFVMSEGASAAKFKQVHKCDCIYSEIPKFLRDL